MEKKQLLLLCEGCFCIKVVCWKLSYDFLCGTRIYHTPWNMYIQYSRLVITSDLCYMLSFLSTFSYSNIGVVNSTMDKIFLFLTFQHLLGVPSSKFHTKTEVSNFKGFKGHNCGHVSSGGLVTHKPNSFCQITWGNFTIDCTVSWWCDDFTLSHHKRHRFLVNNINFNSINYIFMITLQVTNRGWGWVHADNLLPVGHS